MLVSHCSSCHRVYIARPAYCCCGGQEFRAEEASGRGRVYSCTTLHAAAERFEKDLPFQIAIVELDEGVRLTARIRGAGVDVDGAVRWVEERDGVHFFSGV